MASIKSLLFIWINMVFGTILVFKSDVTKVWKSIKLITRKG